MLNVVIFGAPGSGKGTQSELIINKYGLYHISTGEVLRGEIKSKTELGIIAEEYISKGQLVPDEITIKMLTNIIDTNKSSKGFIFDGFPRNLNQGEALDILLRAKGTAITAIINLSVDEPELIKRLLKRGEESGRSDDNLETINKRLEVYRTQTEPLKEFYKKQGKNISISGTGSVDEIFSRIAEALDRIKEATSNS
ncbi:adenylate kinase [Bacteroidales bacterium]|nr:adenylate kinase [Bacteroidales bacterium]